MIYKSQLRFPTYDDVVVSAHFDDAVFSLGGSMLAWRQSGRRVLVVTVFGHGQNEPPDSSESRYGNYAARELEDHNAMAALDVDYVWLNQPELIFRDKGLSDVARYVLPFLSLSKTKAFEAMLGELLAVLHEVAPHAELHFPLAVGSHPDHRLLYEAGRALVDSRQVQFYEDVPYALYPTFVRLRLAHLMGAEGPSARDAARDVTALIDRGVSGPVTFLPLVAYLTSLSATFRALRIFRRHWQRLVREERVVAPFQARKTAAMRAYTSQISLFFASPEQLDTELPTHEGLHVERSWRFT